MVPTSAASTIINNTTGESIKNNSYNEYNYYLNWSEVIPKINEFRNNNESDSMVIKTIFKSLPKLGHPTEEVDIKELEKQTILHLNKYDPVDLSMIFYWACKMNFGSGSLRQSIAQNIIDRHDLDDISSKHLMLMLYGTAVLSREEKLIKRELNFFKVIKLFKIEFIDGI